MSIKAPKGTKDILPEEITNWQNIEKVASDVFTNLNLYRVSDMKSFVRPLRS